MKIFPCIMMVALASAPLSINSCSTIAGLTGVNIENTPGVSALKTKQDDLVKKHSKATICLLESQKYAADALGMQKVVAEIDAEILHLKSKPNDSSVLTSSMDSLSGNFEVLNKKLSEVTNKENIKIDSWKESCKKLNEGMIEEAKLAASNAELALTLTKLIKSAGPMEKALLATEFRPIVYFVTTLPKDYQLMTQASAMQDEASKRLDVKLPSMKPVSFKLPDVSFSF